MPRGTLQTISNFGDLAVLLPLSAVLVVVLWRCESRRAGICLGVSVLLGLLAIFLLKLAMLSGELPVGSLPLNSPSGHACMSILVYGALAVICLRHLPAVSARATALGLIMLVAAIAATRVHLHYHSRTEVAVGLLAGAACLAGFTWSYLKVASPRTIDPRILVGATCLAIALTLQHRLPAERWVRRMALAAQCEHASPARPAPCPAPVSLRALPAHLVVRVERLLAWRAI